MNFYPPKPVVFPPQTFPLKPWMLRARKVSKSIFPRSLPLSRLTVEGDRTFPAALFEEKRCAPNLTCCRKIFQFLKGLTVDMFYQVVRKDFCFWIRMEMQGTIFLVKVFRRLKFLADKERSAKESQAMFLRAWSIWIYIYIYVCIYIAITRHVYCTISDKATG